MEGIKPQVILFYPRSYIVGKQKQGKKLKTRSLLKSEFLPTATVAYYNLTTKKDFDLTKSNVILQDF